MPKKLFRRGKRKLYLLVVPSGGFSITSSEASLSNGKGTSMSPWKHKNQAWLTSKHETRILCMCFWIKLGMRCSIAIINAIAKQFSFLIKQALITFLHFVIIMVKGIIGLCLG